MDSMDLVVKIGSMALIRQEDNAVDYNTLSRLSADLRPGMIVVSSGATEIGRVDYGHRTGHELQGELDDIKTDYAAQGQAILMENYRRFIDPSYSVRQVLVEHQHFNNPQKREHIRQMLLRCPAQGAIPIVNYNDPVSAKENRRMELSALRAQHQQVVECIDNDETAAVITSLVQANTLVILSSVEGIYEDPHDSSTLIREIVGDTPEELLQNVRKQQEHCVGASRAGANGARAKLEYVLGPAMQGTRVLIGHARHRLPDLLNGSIPCTTVSLRSSL